MVASKLLFPLAHYTVGVEGRRIDAIVEEHGKLVLENLPFELGQAVEVLVQSRTTRTPSEPNGTLCGSVLEYRDPCEPVAAVILLDG